MKCLISPLTYAYHLQFCYRQCTGDCWLWKNHCGFRKMFEFVCLYLKMFESRISDFRRALITSEWNDYLLRLLVQHILLPDQHISIFTVRQELQIIVAIFLQDLSLLHQQAIMGGCILVGVNNSAVLLMPLTG